MTDSGTGKRLVAYFSASGVTARAARALAQAAGADLFEIVPEEPYTTADLDWRNRRSRSSLEERDPSVRPAVASAVGDMDAYDTVFVGFPIWWGHEPAIVDTFLEQYDSRARWWRRSRPRAARAQAGLTAGCARRAPRPASCCPPSS